VTPSATLAFTSDEFVIDSRANHNRLIYQQITSFGIQAIPRQSARMFQKLWVSIVTKQSRQVILQHRTA
jgi:hypothetical protein